MASVPAIRDGLKTRVATISGINVYDVIPQVFEAPAAVIRPGDPLIVFDQTMGRGSDDLVFEVTVYVPLVSDVEAQDDLDAFLAGSGASSVKAAIEADGTLGGVAHFTRVMAAGDYGPASVNGVPYLSVSFTVGVTASGS